MVSQNNLIDTIQLNILLRIAWSSCWCEFKRRKQFILVYNQHYFNVQELNVFFSNIKVLS